MVKEKKISIKYFLNKRVKPIVNNNGEKAYRLYNQIVFNRQNIQSPPLKDGVMAYATEEECDFLNKNIDFDDFFEIKKVIEYESLLVGIDNYVLKGLVERFEFYGKSVITLIISNVEEYFANYLQENLIYKEYIKMENNYSFQEKDNNFLDNRLFHFYNYTTEHYPQLIKDLPKDIKISISNLITFLFLIYYIRYKNQKVEFYENMPLDNEFLEIINSFRMRNFYWLVDENKGKNSFQKLINKIKVNDLEEIEFVKWCDHIRGLHYLGRYFSSKKLKNSNEFIRNIEMIIFKSPLFIENKAKMKE